MKYPLLILAFVWLSGIAVAQDFDLMDSALAQVGMTHEDVRFDMDEMATWGGDAMRLSYFTMLHKNPFKLPKYGLMNLEAFTTDCGNLAALVGNAAHKIDCPVRRSLIGDPLEPYLKQVDSLPVHTFTARNHYLPGKQFDRLRRKIDLLSALLADDHFIYNTCCATTGNTELRRQIFEYFVADSQQYNDTVEALNRRIDFNRLAGGAEDIAEALQKTSDSLELCAFPDQVTSLPTPWGDIVLGTTGNDTYEYQEPPLLILDPSGNDSYHISGFKQGYGLAAIIDGAGDDHYLSTDLASPGIGGVVLGLAFVIDRAGNDRYYAVNVAQGAGIFGVSALMDYRGNDSYQAKTNSQGCGIFGAGILSDSLGNDSLYCWASSQGFGYTRGCGLCVNYSGDDVYIAEDSTIFSPGQQTQEHNSSLAQGAGFGKRADYVDGHSWAGGIGILCDISGNDKYSAGLFAQGCGYWFALGMLLDGSGDDDYRSVWYTLGSGAHFAIGYLDDFAGNDKYNATMNMSIGSGHDFTIGYFNDRGGDDSYLAPGLSLGGGNFQGMGIFDDWNGNDTYTSSGGFNLGGARGLRQGARTYLNTFGIFVDGGGNDVYSDPRVRNRLRWISPKSDSTNPDQREIGVGIDK